MFPQTQPCDALPYRDERSAITAGHGASAVRPVLPRRAYGPSCLFTDQGSHASPFIPVLFVVALLASPQKKNHLDVLFFTTSRLLVMGMQLFYAFF